MTIPRTHRATLISNESGDRLRRSGSLIPTAYRIGLVPNPGPTPYCDPNSAPRTIYRRECPCCGACYPPDMFDDRYGNRLSGKYWRSLLAVSDRGAINDGNHGGAILMNTTAIHAANTRLSVLRLRRVFVSTIDDRTALGALTARRMGPNGPWTPRTPKACLSRRSAAVDGNGGLGGQRSRTPHHCIAFLSVAALTRRSAGSACFCSCSASGARSGGLTASHGVRFMPRAETRRQCPGMRSLRRFECAGRR